MKKYDYSKNKHCKCGKLITNDAISCNSCAKKDKNNPMYNIKGSKHPTWIDGRTNNNKCFDCNKNITYDRKRCIKCYRKFNIGINHPNWQGGKDISGYPYEFNKSLKESIRKRDNYKCQLCNKKEISLKTYRKKLCIHHIDYNKQNYKKKNLISLCHNCNIKVNSNRDYWYAYFRYIIINFIYKK